MKDEINDDILKDDVLKERIRCLDIIQGLRERGDSDMRSAIYWIQSGKQWEEE